MEKDYYYQCPVCKRMLKLEISKNNKPYCTCNDCGIQLFIRGKKGINRLSKLIGKMALTNKPKELINTIDYINALKDKLEEIRSNKPLIGRDLDLELQEKAIIKQLGRLRNRIRE